MPRHRELPSRHVDTDRLLAVVERENRRILEASAGLLDRPVTGCPGWDVAQLLRHLGSVHRWAAGIVGTGATGRPRRENAPAEPADPAALATWFEQGIDELLAALRAADPAGRSWTWTGPQPPPWWARRQAMEALIHRVDVEQAGGRAWPEVDPDVAVAGVEEMLEDFAPYERPSEELGEPGRTVHLHALDRECEWLLRLHAGGVEVTRGHARGDAAVRGPAGGLLLWLWNRLPVSQLELIGDPEAAAAWTRETGR